MKTFHRILFLIRKILLRYFFDYKVEEPTLELIDEWEVDHNTTFGFKRKQEREMDLEM